MSNTVRTFSSCKTSSCEIFSRLSSPVSSCYVYSDMPHFEFEHKPENRLVIHVTVSREETQPYLEEAAKRISEKTPPAGFRPGKAGFEIIKRQVGEMQLYEEALQSIVHKSSLEAIHAQHIEPVGSPHIDVQKLAPGNDIQFTVEITRMPRIENLADFQNLKIQGSHPVVEEKEVERAMKDLQRMQTKEIRVLEKISAIEKDKVVISIDMKKDGVSVEGGQSPNHAIYLQEAYYIPEFKEQLVGMKEGEQKIFTLPFPKEHLHSFLAGMDIEFHVELKELFHLEHPVIDDAFAESLGIKDLSTLRQTLIENLQKEKNQKEFERQERSFLELLAQKTRYEPLPDMLVNEEIDKMIQELKHSIESRGGVFNDYLKHLGKSLVDLKLDMTPQAIVRIKVALVLRMITEQENIHIDEQEINEHLDQIASEYRTDDVEAKKRIYSPKYQEYTKHILLNRKVIEFLRAIMVENI